jgi:hypothetical protein
MSSPDRYLKISSTKTLFNACTSLDLNFEWKNKCDCVKILKFKILKYNLLYKQNLVKP